MPFGLSAHRLGNTSRRPGSLTPPVPRGVERLGELGGGPKLRAGKLQVATHCLSYDNLTHPYDPTPEKTQEVIRLLPQTQHILGVTLHYTSKPTTNRWYTDGSKRHISAGGGISNGHLRAAFPVHGPQQMHRAETMACTVGSQLAQPKDEIILDHQGVVKATLVGQRPRL